MTNDDATIPMHAPQEYPTWPAQPPALPPNAARPARARASFRPGCGGALALIGAFIAGVAITALLFSAFILPDPVPATSKTPTDGALKVTITDAFLNEALNTSSASATLTNVQTHIQAGGKLTISGILQGTPFAAGQTAVIVLAPTVSQGQLSVKAVSGSIGGFPLPGIALNQIASSLNQQITQVSRPSLGGGKSLTVKALSFADGEMTIIYV